jgi:hypothetical protein
MDLCGCLRFTVLCCPMLRWGGPPSNESYQMFTYASHNFQKLKFWIGTGHWWPTLKLMMMMMIN